MPKIEKDMRLAMMQAHVKAGEKWMKLPETEKYAPKNSVWDVSWPTYIENWPAMLHALSIPSISLKLTLEQARVMGRNIIELGESFKESIPENHAEIKAEIIRKLDEAVKQFPDGAFVRLGSRSPKDSFYWGIGGNAQQMNGKLTSGRMAFELLTCASERICDDLHTQIAMNYEPYIWVRKGLDLPEWCEFRCFMQHRQLIGISQYYYHHPIEELEGKYDKIYSAIKRFFVEKFRDASHLDSVVFDVFLTKVPAQLLGMCYCGQEMEGHSIYDNHSPVDMEYPEHFEAHLLEINPFSNLTDPCMFNWNKPEEFQGQVRLRVIPSGEQNAAD